MFCAKKEVFGRRTGRVGHLVAHAARLDHLAVDALGVGGGVRALEVDGREERVDVLVQPEHAVVAGGAAGLAGEVVPAPAAVRPQLAREHDGLVPEQLRGLAEVGLRGRLLLGGAPARVLLLDKLDALVDVDPVLVVLVLRPVRLPGLPVDWATVASATARRDGWDTLLNSLLATPDQPGSGRIVSMSVASCARWAERLAVWGSPP